MRHFNSVQNCPKCTASRTNDADDDVFKVTYNNGHGAPAFDDHITVKCNVCGHHWQELAADASDEAKAAVDKIHPPEPIDKSMGRN